VRGAGQRERERETLEWEEHTGCRGHQGRHWREHRPLLREDQQKISRGYQKREREGAGTMCCMLVGMIVYLFNDPAGLFSSFLWRWRFN
jgi:hypothetical protein